MKGDEASTNAFGFSQKRPAATGEWWQRTSPEYQERIMQKQRYKPLRMFTFEGTLLGRLWKIDWHRTASACQIHRQLQDL